MKVKKIVNKGLPIKLSDWFLDNQNQEPLTLLINQRIKIIERTEKLIFISDTIVIELYSLYTFIHQRETKRGKFSSYPP